MSTEAQKRASAKYDADNTIYSNCFFGGGYYCEHYWDKNLAKQLGEKRFRKLVQDWRKHQDGMGIEDAGN